MGPEPRVCLDPLVGLHPPLSGVKHTIVWIDMDDDAQAEMIIDVFGHVELTERDFIL